MGFFSGRKKRRHHEPRQKSIPPVRGGYAAAVLLCAGEGVRAGKVNKLIRPILGKSALRRSLETLAACETLRNIAIVVSAQTRNHAAQLLESMGNNERFLLIDGGDTRGDSALAGLRALNRLQPAPTVVAIHDAARCLLRPDVLDACLQSARAQGSGVAGLPATDTIRRVSEHGVVIGEMNRDELWHVQTPQTFAFDLILRCYEEAFAEGQTASDDATLIARNGYEVHMVRSSFENIKITHPEDFVMAEFFLKSRMTPEAFAQNITPVRIGFGEDIHRLVFGRKLILGGIEIPHESGLDGHSDADVLVHAVMDALLGAAAMGDIGKHFPDYDVRFKDADSILLLKQVASMLRKRAYRVVNIDATIVAERPKLAPHIEQMCIKLAQTLDIAPSCVSIKATTSEGLGYEGRCEGIVAKAVALIAGAQ